MRSKVCFWKQPSEKNKSFQENSLTVFISQARSNSSILTRMFAAMNDGRVIMHEPGVPAYNNEAQSNQQKPELTGDQVADGIPSFQVLSATILKELKTNNVFIKEMAFAAKHYFNSDFPPVAAAKTQFFFLLRDPAKAYVSTYNVLPIELDANLKDALSYEDMLDLFHNLRECNNNVYLIDSTQLIEDPKAILKFICDKSNIPYKESCLTWEALGNNDRIGPYCRFVPQWQDNIKNSTGIVKTLSKPIKCDGAGNPTFEEIPAERRQAYLDYYFQQKPYYDQLAKYLEEQHVDNLNNNNNNDDNTASILSMNSVQ